METIKEAKEHLRNNFEEGIDCPCCGQFVKLYKRKLNSGMAATLIRIVKFNGSSEVHVKDFLRKHQFHNGHDWTRLKDWGLLQEIIEDNVKSSGKWKVTANGLKFAANQLEVKSHILVYDNRFLGHEGENIRIKDALGEKFDFNDLMQGN